MLEKTHLKHVIDTRRVKCRYCILLTWSCSPEYVCQLFLDDKRHVKKMFIGSTILCFFQRWAYDEGFQYEDCGSVQSRRCRKQYQDYTEGIVKEVREDVDIRFFQILSNESRNYQLHTKACVIVNDDGSTDFLQFSWNASLSSDDTTSLVYKGLPTGLRKLTEVLTDQERFLDKFQGVCGSDMRGVLTTCRSIHNAVLSLRSDAFDKYCELVVTLPKHPFSNERVRGNPEGLPPLRRLYVSLEDMIHQILHRHAAGNTTYSEYVVKRIPSIIVAMYNFVDSRMLDSICEVVGSTFSIDDEDDRPRVTTAYPETYVGNTQVVHEKFVYKLADGAIKWLFFCSHNLTPASWNAPKRAGDDGTWQKQVPKNFETGILMFQEMGGTAAWKPVEEYLLGYYSQNVKYVKFHTMRCLTTKTSIDAARAPQRLRYDPKHKTLVSMASRPPGVCRGIGDTAWARYENRRRCLEQYLLRGVTGVSDLLSHQEFLGDTYTRYALYEHVFVHLGGDLPWKTGGNYNRKVLRSFFQRKTVGQDYIGVDDVKDSLVVETLIDIFLIWGRAFELFDPNILLVRPPVTPDTLVDYERLLVAKEPTPFLIDPKRLTKARDDFEKAERDIAKRRVQKTSGKRSPRLPKDVDVYESLSFVIQHLFETYEVWWQCPTVASHRFYWEVKSIFEKPECKVCCTSPEVRAIYETLRQSNPEITAVTVEFTLFKRESDKKQEELLDYYLNHGHLYWGGVRGTKRDGVNIARTDRSGKYVRGPDGKIIVNPDLLCQGVKSKSNLLQNMRYDVFFYYNGHFVAIEADDPSHRVLKENSKYYVRRTNAKPASEYHNQDAVKNVVSYLLNVHMVRIATPEPPENMDAQTLIPAYIEQILEWVKTNSCKAHTSMKRLYDDVSAIVGNLRPATTASIKAVDIANPSTLKKDGYYDATQPISCVLSTTPTKGRDNLYIYVKAGMLHAAYREAKPVVLCHYVDFFSLYYNWYSFRLFKLSRAPTASETWYRFNPTNHVGMLFDSHEHGGVHVFTTSYKKRPFFSFNINRSFAWENDERISGVDVDGHRVDVQSTQLKDPLGLVRLVSNYRKA